MLQFVHHEWTCFVPSKLFLYKASKVCWFHNICHIFHTFMQTFHTLGIHFIPKWAVFIPGAGFSYLFGIIKKVWYEIVLLSTSMVFFHTQIRCFGTSVYCFIFEMHFIPIWYEKMDEVWNWLAYTFTIPWYQFTADHKGTIPRPCLQQGCATAGDGHGCSQSRRAGSRGAVINRSVPGRKGMKNVPKVWNKSTEVWK